MQDLYRSKEFTIDIITLNYNIQIWFDSRTSKNTS